jgi:diguanylate cyclase (GGDEF)-like protein
MRPNDAYFDLLIETLEGLEPTARAQFLQRFFQSLSHIDVPENQVVSVWEEVLARRAQLSERSESLVSFQTALVDVLSASGRFRLPVVLEYEELKNLQRNAVTDPLTGLQNRRLFDETLEKELNRARRYAQPLSLVTLDLHRFKEVNDKHGHPRGDEVLHAAATTLRKALRTSDSAFRTGGDEFALILPQTDSAQASALSRRIGIVFSEILRPLNLTISVSMDHGVATYPQDADQRDQLIRIADERLYHFKHRSRDEAVAERPAASTSTTPTAPLPAPQAESQTPVSVETPPPASHSALAAEPPAPTPVEIAPSPATPPPPAAPPSPLQTSRPSFPLAPEETRIYAVPRKAERVSMSGTNAYAVLADQPVQRARVVDLGFGGVALDFPSIENIPETLLAVLHVPILPPVRVSLKRLWTRQLSEDTVRVGCCFIS